MPVSRLLRAAPLAAATLLLAWAGSAIAGDRDRAPGALGGGAPAFTPLTGVNPLQHGPPTGHLPATQQNIQLMSKLEMSTPPNLRTAETANDALLPEQIADVAVHKGFAYLNSWDEPTCQRGGTFIVDVNNPGAPQQIGFLPALEGRYHGEGAHVITLDTPAFQGDLLAVNNEPYTACAEDPNVEGGFDLYDVTNPRAPRTMVQGAGDTGGEGELTGDSPSAHSSHSIFIWQGNDRRAYAVTVDNIEDHDVDIFEITNPAEPRPVGEFDFDAMFDIEDQGGLGGEADRFLHDMVVKKIGDRYVMLADYWDSGYVTVDITNPANPQYIGDTSFDGPDPLTGRTPTEGNGHQGEFSHDNRYILAADEDFSPFRPRIFEIATGPNAGQYEAAPVGGGTSPGFLPDETLNGPTVYGGYGCDASDPIPPRDSVVGLPELEEGEEAILVLQRGPGANPDTGVPDDPNNTEPACFPGEKAENGIDAGYDAVLLVNHHRGEAGGVFCGSGDFPTGRPIVAICTSHEALHHIFGLPPTTEIPYVPGNEPVLGEVGEEVEATVEFDGWGYTHLFANTPGKMRRIDSHAIEEALNPRLAFGFGDLSVHEFATDPTEYVAYSSYYSGGMRVFTFDDGGLVEQGKFIDQGGSNFWGVEQFTGADGQRYFVGSDRDFGLYVFRYTGPGAAQRPVCADSVTMVPFKSSASVALPCSDANGNPLTRAVTAQPTAGTLGAVGEAVSYTHTGNSLGNADQFQFTANDGAATSAPATARIVAVPRDGGRCFNPFAGTARRESINGSRFGDRIRGAGGNDTINGRGGADCLSGQGGRDRVSSGSGNDRANGGAGNDRVKGGAGRDRLSGGGGNDRLEAGSGRSNRLSGGGGRDTLLAKNGARDTIRCGKGRDTVRADRRDRVSRDCERVRRR